MSTLHLITVATHNHGMFDKLINNEYGIKIKVLGFGQKWTGFRMKFELMYDYIKTLPENDIVVFLDGFDTKILKSIDNLKNDFLKFNTKILFSKDEANLLSMSYRVFPRCKDNLIANTGLYMGYVKYIRIILNDILNQKCKDDQVLINNISCKKYNNWIKIDKDCIIFQNDMYKSKNNKKIDAYFYQYAANMNSNRFYRAIFEYLQYFIVPVIILYLILFAILLKYQLYRVNIFITLLLVILILKSDWSCIS